MGAAQYDAVLINLMLIVAIKSHVNMRANILNMIFSSQEVSQEVCYPLKHLNYFTVFYLRRWYFFIKLSYIKHW